MNVLYDITVLGMGQQQKISRTGVFRVVDNVAINLLQNSGVQLTLCADTSLNVTAFACQYINETKSYKNASFLYPPDYTKRLKYLNYQNLILQKLIQNNSNIKLSEKIWLKSNLKRIQFLNKLTSTESISKKEIQKHSIYHSPFFAISNNIKSAGLKSIFLTVYDLIPIKYPHFFEEKMTWSVKNALSNITPETWVFCISNSTKNDLLNYMGNKINPGKVIVTELAASEMFYKSSDKEYNKYIQHKYSIPNLPYILSLCTLEPRKNILTAIRSFAKMIEQEHIADLNLVLVGTKGWNFDQIFEEIDNSKNLKNRIIITGFIPDEDLAAIYSDALFFVYPSFYEGFGLPLLEAMRCGIPVITSNTSSLPEVVGNAGIMIDPTDEDALSAAMLALYQNKELRKSLSEKSINRAVQFNWARCAQETINAYSLSLI